ERIDRDVDLRTLAAAHLLADVQHRGLVALALPDDDGPPEGHLVHRLPHGLDRGLVGEAVVAVSDPMRGRDSGGLGDAHELEAWDATVGHGWTHRATRYRLLRAPAARASPPRPRCAAAGRASPPRDRPRPTRGSRSATGRPRACARAPARACRRRRTRGSPDAGLTWSRPASAFHTRTGRRCDPRR